MVKIKIQKVFGANSYVCKSYRGTLIGSAILNRVKEFPHIRSLIFRLWDIVTIFHVNQDSIL